MKPAYEYTDEQIVSTVKTMMDKIKEKSLHGYEGIFATAAAAALIDATVEMNATEFTIKMTGFSKRGGEKADWEVMIKKVF